MLRIVGLAVLAAVTYGVVHDQITARLCVEYFTIGHPRVIDSDSPTLLGLVWGVIATWWVGVLLGIPLAIAARSGTRPKRTARSLIRPILILLVVMAVTATLAGLLGHRLADRGAVVLLEPLASRVPVARHTAFLTALWAHSASYLAGFVGGLVLIVVTWRSRRPKASAR